MLLSLSVERFALHSSLSASTLEFALHSKESDSPSGHFLTQTNLVESKAGLTK